MSEPPQRREMRGGSGRRVVPAAMPLATAAACWALLAPARGALGWAPPAPARGQHALALLWRRGPPCAWGPPPPLPPLPPHRSLALCGGGQGDRHRGADDATSSVCVHVLRRAHVERASASASPAAPLRRARADWDTTACPSPTLTPRVPRPPSPCGPAGARRPRQDIEDLGSAAQARSLSAKDARAMAGKLVKWYHVHKRDLPWRHQERWPQAPYAVWVSEIMLQQTRVATVIDYFTRWMAKWPTVELLAAATEEEVNEMWSGLGYYRRARMLHQGAKTVVDTYKGRLPSTVDELKGIPGIGAYTAGAISSIAFGNKEPLVDGNVVRVLSRLFALGDDPKAPASVKVHWDLARALVKESGDPAALNQGLRFHVHACSLRVHVRLMREVVPVYMRMYSRT